MSLTAVKTMDLSIHGTAGTVTNSILATDAVTNVKVAAGAAIAYSKLNLTGAILNADLAGSISDSKLSTITTAGKVADSALSSNIPLLNATLNAFTTNVTFGG